MKARRAARNYERLAALRPRWRFGRPLRPERSYQVLPSADIRRAAEQAEEARQQAERAISSLDKEEWLRVAAEWTKLAQDAEKRSRNR